MKKAANGGQAQKRDLKYSLLCYGREGLFSQAQKRDLKGTLWNDSHSVLLHPSPKEGFER